MAGMETRANLLPSTSKDIQLGLNRWTFLPMEQCWRPVMDNTTKLCAPTLEGARNPIIAVKGSTAFGLAPSGELLAIATTMGIEIWNPTDTGMHRKVQGSNLSLTCLDARLADASLSGLYLRSTVGVGTHNMAAGRDPWSGIQRG